MRHGLHSARYVARRWKEFDWPGTFSDALRKANAIRANCVTTPWRRRDYTPYGWICRAHKRAVNSPAILRACKQTQSAEALAKMSEWTGNEAPSSGLPCVGRHHKERFDEVCQIPDLDNGVCRGRRVRGRGAIVFRHPERLERSRLAEYVGADALHRRERTGSAQERDERSSEHVDR